MPSPSEDAREQARVLFRLLTSNSPSDKYTAAERTNETPRRFDGATLRALIVEALQRDYYVGREDELDAAEIADTRGWLLSALGRLATDDETATRLVVSHVSNKAEPSPWARYWALEGLIAGGSDRVDEIAREAEQDDAAFVAMLASAYLAAKGDHSAQATIRDRFANRESQWDVLRALRIVPLPFMVLPLCRLVERAEYTDVSYDAIVALGRLPPDTTPTHLAEASTALSTAITRLRRNRWKDGMRAMTITALGNLKVETSASLLLDELTDDNPAIVREAMLAVAKILNLRTAVARVVEAATRRGSLALTAAYAQALRWLDRKAVAGELSALMGFGDADQQEVCRHLLTEMGGAVAYEKLRARTAALQQYNDVLERTERSVRDLFDRSVREAQKGFLLATWMDLTVFGVGILLIVASALEALLRGGDFRTWAGVGGTGVLGVVYGLLISNPRKQLADAVDHLMKIKIVFLAYLRRLHQTDQAYTRLLIESDRITIEQLEAYSGMIGTIMATTTRELKAAGASAEVPPRAVGGGAVLPKLAEAPRPVEPSRPAEPAPPVTVTLRPTGDGEACHEAAPGAPRPPAAKTRPPSRVAGKAQR